MEHTLVMHGDTTALLGSPREWACQSYMIYVGHGVPNQQVNMQAEGGISQCILAAL